MDSNNFFSIIQQGFRTAVGATTSVIETIQDSQKREQTLSELREEWQKKVKEWEEKGEITEQEARRMMDDFLKKNPQNEANNDSTSSSNNAYNVTNPSLSKPNTIREIQKLTQAIVTLRTELEKVKS
jgi:polyhydroxyalkanoate synthesis regulator phasin